MHIMDLLGMPRVQNSVTDIPKLPPDPSVEHLGEVGPNPFAPPASPGATPSGRAGMTFNELFNLDRPAAPALAAPTPTPAQSAAPGAGGAPAPIPAQQGAGFPATPVAPAGGANRPSLAPVVPSVPRADGRDMLRDTARALIQHGSPAQKVQGVQMLFEANQPTPDERAEMERQRAAQAKAEQQQAQLEATMRIIDGAPASEADKAMARTQAQARILLGDQATEIMDSLGVTQEAKNKRAELANTRNEKLSRWQQTSFAEESTIGTVEVAADLAFDLIDKGVMTTGTAGWLGQMLPGSDANKLLTYLKPIQAIIGFDRLQQMREASKTGGALGSVSERELQFLQAVQGSLDPVNQSPEALKTNIVQILAGKRLLSELHELVPLLDAGDPAAHKQARELSRQVGSLAMRVKSEIEAKPKAAPAAPQGPVQGPDGAMYEWVD